MVKTHTKEKRKFGGGTHLRKVRHATRNRATRPKSFSSEEIARKWAEAKGIKEYTLKNLRCEHSKDKKIVVVQ